MVFEKISLDNLTVVGISVRTTNANGQAQKDISTLWESFFSNNIIASIPNKISDDIYCLYTDYESDYQGAYTTVLGCVVSSASDISVTEWTIKEIPTGKYYKYVSQGKLPECVGATWMQIWESSDIDRKYSVDFDVYGKESHDPDNAIVNTYLSIK